MTSGCVIDVHRDRVGRDLQRVELRGEQVGAREVTDPGGGALADELGIAGEQQEAHLLETGGESRAGSRRSTPSTRAPRRLPRARWSARLSRSSHGARSVSVSGMPSCICAFAASLWKSSASRNGTCSASATRRPIVVFPTPVTPMTTMIGCIRDFRPAVTEGRAIIAPWTTWPSSSRWRRTAGNGTSAPRCTSRRRSTTSTASVQAGAHLRAVEVEEVGDVTGRELLHLQCHFGLDTLSWARRGARVTGLDFSESAVEAARALADAEGIDAEFVCANVYDAVAALSGRTYDVVYTGIGALCWLPDIDRWAETAGRAGQARRLALRLRAPPVHRRARHGRPVHRSPVRVRVRQRRGAPDAMGRCRLVRGAGRGRPSTTSPTSGTTASARSRRA